MGTKPVRPSPAATVILLRDNTSGFEVLMVHRKEGGFFGGLAVFPGGAVDDVDTGDLAGSVVVGEHEDRHYRAAALRELAEETGLLLGPNRVGPAPDLRGETLYRALAGVHAELSGDRLVLVSRWVTPVGAPRRFDTRFYVATVGEVPDVRLDETELVGHTWIRPETALSRHSRGEWSMILPTLAHLRWLERRSSIDDALETASGADGRELVEPKEMEDGSIVPVLVPVEGT